MLIIAFALGGANSKVANHNNPSRSTYNSGAGGLRALYLTLDRLGYRVSRWRQPLTGAFSPRGS